MIKEVAKEELKQAIDLVNDVFSEFVAVDYSEQGRNTFMNYLKNKYEEVLADVESGHKKMWGFYDGNKILGVIATRDISHISLMFVDKQYHKKGIASKLFHTMLKDLEQNNDITQITVNSSPYAVKVYEHFHFEKTGEQQEKDGIIFIPMVRQL